jgi:hypothetical protein
LNRTLNRCCRVPLLAACTKLRDHGSPAYAVVVKAAVGNELLIKRVSSIDDQWAAPLCLGDHVVDLPELFPFRHD